MSSVASKKASLINHIMWKISYKTPEERAKELKYIKKLSLANLTAYAIRNDYIDA